MSRALHDNAGNRRPPAYRQTHEYIYRRCERPGDVTKQYSPRNNTAPTPHIDEGRYAYDPPYEQRTRQFPQKRNPPKLNMSRLLMYITFVLIVALCFVQITRLANIAQNTKQISNLSTEIRRLASEKTTQLQRLSMQQNITRVREEAIYKLGMIQPEDGQIRVVSLNGHSANTQTRTADGSSAMGESE